MESMEIGMVAAESGTAIKEEMTLEERLFASMYKAANHWMVMDENQQMFGAIEAVIRTYKEDDPEFKRITVTLDRHKKLNALISASQAGLNVSLSDTDPDENADIETIDLRGIWRKAQKAKKRDNDPEFKEYLEAKEKYLKLKEKWESFEEEVTEEKEDTTEEKAE